MEKNSTDMAGLRARLLDAALEHVAFDGWSVATFAAAVADTGADPGLAKVLFPRGAFDMAVAYHKRSDALMVEALSAQDLGALRFRERVALAVRLRLEVAEPEAVRRGAALFALPQNLATGAGLIWGTADAIWRALGDNSQDINWYSKRASLSAVYSATVLYWLGDSSEDHKASWEFLDRRIEDVMRFEKTKADFRASPMAKVLAGPLGLLERIKAPAPGRDDLPGKTFGKTN
ncbi:MAG: COQ9 family protein [Albidovulum sp.]